MTTAEPQVFPAPEDYNGWADHYRYVVGPNVIPWNKPNGLNDRVNWRDWQDKPIPEELHNEWKHKGWFKDGIAIIAGTCWHRKPFDPKLRIWIADPDKQSSIDLILTRNGKTTTIQELSKIFIIEVHEEDSSRVHIMGYYLSDKPYPNMTSPFEIKCDGTHGIVRCTNSIRWTKDKDGNFVHNGHRFKVIDNGVIVPTANNEFLQYMLHLGNGRESGGGAGLRPTADLFKEETKIFEGENRHLELMRAIESMIKNNCPRVSLTTLKRWAIDINNNLCVPPLDEKEFEKQWKCALKYGPISDHIFESKNTKSESPNDRREKKDKKEDINNIILLNPKSTGGDSNSNESDGEDVPEEVGVKLSDKVIKTLYDLFTNHHFEPNLIYKIFSYFHKNEISLASCLTIIDVVTTDEEERRRRRNILGQIFNDTYSDLSIIDITSKRLLFSLTDFYRDNPPKQKIRNVARKVFSYLIDVVIGTQDPVRWLSDTAMKEHDFATMMETEEIYYYNNQGIFVKGGKTILRKWVEVIYPSATAHQKNEVVTHVKDYTSVSQSDFDKDIDIVVTDNCVLNIHTLDKTGGLFNSNSTSSG